MLFLNFPQESSEAYLRLANIGLLVELNEPLDRNKVTKTETMIFFGCVQLRGVTHIVSQSASGYL